MKYLRLLIRFLILLAVLPVFAQIPSGYVQTTATVPGLANGQYAAAWTNLSSSPQLALLGCVSTFQQTVNGNFDAFGHFSVQLADTAQICPSPSTWTFTLTFACSKPPNTAFMVQVPVTGGGGTEDISSQIAAALPSNPCGGGGGGGSGTVLPSPQFQIGYFPNAGTNALVAGNSGATTDIAGNVTELSARTKNSPAADFRAYGGVADGVTDIGPALTSAINSCNAGGSCTVILPCGFTGGPTGSAGCFLANGSSVNWPNGVILKIQLQGVLTLGSTLVVPDNTTLIGDALGIPVQFQGKGAAAEIVGPNVKGTMGTAIVSTNTPVTFTPTFTSGTIANMPINSAITIAGTTTCSASAVRSGNVVVATCSGYTRMPIQTLATITGCSDSSFNITTPIVNADYPVHTLTWSQTASNSTATGCTVTGFNEDTFETVRITNVSGSTVTATFAHTHSSSDQWGMVGVTTAFNTFSHHDFENIAFSGAPGMQFWADNIANLFLTNDGFQAGQFMTSGAAELDDEFVGAIKNSSFLGALNRACVGGACIQSSYPYGLRCSQLPPSLSNNGVGCSGTSISDTFVEGGEKVDTNGFAATTFGSGPTTPISNVTFEQASGGDVVIDARFNLGFPIPFIVTNSGPQDNFLNSPECYVQATDGGGGFVQLNGTEGVATSCLANKYFNGFIQVNGLSAMTLPTGRNAATGSFDDGSAEEKELRGEGAGLGASVVPFTTLPVVTSPSCGTCSTVLGPDGTSDGLEIQTNAGSGVNVTVGFNNLSTYPGDWILFWSWNKPGSNNTGTCQSGLGSNSCFSIFSFGTDTFTQSITGNIVPVNFGMIFDADWWHPQVAMATVLTGETAAHQVQLRLSSPSSGTGSGNDFWGWGMMFIPGPNNPAYNGVTEAEVERWRQQLLHGAVPQNFSSVGTAATTVPIAAPVYNVLTPSTGAIAPFETANLADWTDSGIANGSIPVWNSGTSKWTPGSIGSSVVTSINGTPGAYTFSGSGVSCTSTTCTFSGAGSGIGSITWSLPPFMAASPTTISASGTQQFSFNNQSANTVLAGPTSGGAAAPGFRGLVSADIPNNAANTTGNAATATNVLVSQQTSSSVGNFQIVGANGSLGTAIGLSAGNTTTANFYVTPSTGFLNSPTGFTLNGAVGTAGHIIRSNGSTGYVDGTIQTGDLPTIPIAGGGTNATSAAAGTVPNATSGTASSWTATPTLGASGTLGSLTLGNATSGLLTLQPVTGALGTVTASLPANTGTIAELNLAQTWSALQTFGTNISIGGVTAAGATGTSNVVFSNSPTLVTPALGTPASGVITNLTGTCTSCDAAGLAGSPSTNQFWGFNGTSQGFYTLPTGLPTKIYTTSQTAVSADNGFLVIMNCSSCSYTLPVSQPATQWGIAIQFTGTGDTIALSGGATYNSGSSAPPVNQYAIMGPIVADQQTTTDYFGPTPPVAGSNITLTAAQNGYTLAATSGGSITPAAQYDVPYYSAAGTSTTLNGTAISGFVFATTGAAPAAATAAQLGGLLNIASNAVLYSGGTSSAVLGVTPVNNAVLVTNGSGTPSESTAVPNGVTATTQSAGDSSNDIATDSFVTTAVNNAVAGVNPAVAVLAASIGSNITGTYSNGVGGIGATFTVTATGAFSLDGVAINTIGQRVLLKDQSSAFQNGVYTATVVGTTGVSPVFTRALDYDQPSDINSTGAIPVQSGTANATTSWLLTSTVNTVGTDALTYTQFSLAPTSIVTAAANFTSGNLVKAAASNKTTADSGIAAANVVLASSPGAGIAHFAGSTQTVTSSAVALTDMATQSADTFVANATAGSASPTAVSMPTTNHGVWLAQGTAAAPVATAAGTAGQVFTSGGGSANPGYIDFPDFHIIPAANCNNTTAGAGWSIGSGGTVVCRAGTNNLGGAVQITDTSSTFAQFTLNIPEDWDTATDPYIRFAFAVVTDTTNGHTVIPQIKVSCPTAGNGTVSDDATFSAAQSSSTVTLGASAVANGFYNGSNVQIGATQMTGCIAGGLMIVQVGRATDTVTGNVNFYSATVTFPRLIVVQAN